MKQIRSEGTNRETECKSEYFSLIAFLITFSFQMDFAYLGNEKTNLILDLFHHKLFDYVTGVLQIDTFPEQLKARYAEYYPAMKKDLDCFRMNIDGAIPFWDITKAFSEKITPGKTISPENLLFSVEIADLYSGLRDVFKRIKEYKIG